MAGLIRLELTRYIPDHQRATLGRLTGYKAGGEPGARFLGGIYTIERSWEGNAPSISCIPVGTYLVTPQRYNRGGYDAYAVQNVLGRTHILFHVANWAREVQGCIGVGLGVGVSSDEQLMVTQSRAAFEMFMHFMDGEPGVVTVANAR